MATKLYVGNLPELTKEKDIRDLFQSFGDVSEVAVLRGYGFVVSFCVGDVKSQLFVVKELPNFFVSLQHFLKSDDAATALDALDGTDFMDSRLQVQVSVPSPLPSIPPQNLPFNPNSSHSLIRCRHLEPSVVPHVTLYFFHRYRIVK